MSRNKPPIIASLTRGAGTPRRLGQLWQAPAFIVGVLVLLPVYFGRPWLKHNDQGLQDRNLEAGRRLLFQPECTPEKMQELVADSLTTGNTTPERSGEAHLLLG